MIAYDPQTPLTDVADDQRKQGRCLRWDSDQRRLVSVPEGSVAGAAAMMQINLEQARLIAMMTIAIEQIEERQTTMEKRLRLIEMAMEDDLK